MDLTGVFGGTFDPVHIGHLRTASDLLDALPMNEIRFLLCGRPPHRDPPVASPAARLAMLRASIAGHADFVADDRELHRDGPSYTVDSLASLRREFPGRAFGLILGMDAFRAFDSWHRWRDILELAHLVVVQRPGSELPAGGAVAGLLADRRVDVPAGLARSGSGAIYLAVMTQLEISSSAIRELVRNGGDPRFLVTGEVRDIIRASGCYGSPTDNKEEARFGA